MTKRNITTTALATILVLALAGWAIAGPGHGRGYCGPGPAGQNPYAQLTPEKQAAVEAIFEKYRPQMDQLRDSLWTKHATMQAMINGGKADEKKLGSLVAEMRNLREKMGELRAAMNDELTRETGIEAPFGPKGRGFGKGFGPDDCPAFGKVYGRSFDGGCGPCGEPRRS
ncbi:periplasmic heavy metal sensor [Pseudodesulfovibrio sp. F-1]|uniref:Periplasmic heavy metal sensor n=1 Tax=Pseudodesulfovibrio alkaliphilus TaxID=2661613 RepID=A0A7K1KKC4_9BACT|nr:Spy/CpxP family protein refolding chaperone [Pseudodesulfovibrio alkaliphilus]MUM76524.1 periplasmic heavy metal sensor [Pseudodesulfovibrio alkaliphilus]